MLPWSIDASDLGPGTHEIDLVIEDRAGNTATFSLTYTVDDSFPYVVIQNPLNNTGTAPGSEILFEIDDDTLTNVYYKRDSGNFLSMPGIGVNYTINTTGWSLGNHLITVQAIDAVGHLTEHWYNISLGIAPGPISNLTVESGDGGVTLRWDHPGDNGSSPVTKYYVWREGMPENILSNSQTYFEDYGLTNGDTYMFWVCALNDYGLGEPTYINATPTNDQDGDGHIDNDDEFPNDPTEWQDSDDDGVGDNADAFPDDDNEWNDTDGDQVGDNSDAFPNDANETEDSDDDGVGNNADAFPSDPGETEDSDNDGVGDNADAFPDDPHEDTDMDADGIGDNSDAFPDDPAASEDSDGDGYPDEWNPGYNEDDSTSGLEIDGYPNNSDMHESVADGKGDDDGGFNMLIPILILLLLIGAGVAVFVMKNKRGGGGDDAEPATGGSMTEEPITGEPMVEETMATEGLSQENAEYSDYNEEFMGQVEE